MNSLLLKTLSSLDGSQFIALREPAEGITWSPDADVFERDGGLVAHMDLPGVLVSDIRTGSGDVR